jgi:D-psicose/D-tagatose/L-ribulose 3-epimerase
MSIPAASNPIGVHALVWVGGWTEPEARTAIESTKAAGYDLIEIPLLDPWSVDVKMTQRLLEENQLGMAASLGLSPETDVSSEDPAVVQSGERLLRQAVDVVRDLGGDYLCGVIYCSLGKYPGPPSDRSRANSVQAMQRLADHAAASDISLGIEVVNRYESNLFNTGRQALEFISDIDRTNVYVHLDTYHMNIEEPDMVSPVLQCGDRLGYVHVGESHRGYLGSGSVDYAGFFRALAQIGYRGTITFESFSSAVVSPMLSNMLAIWRNLWNDSADLANHARSFIDDQLRAVASIEHH